MQGTQPTAVLGMVPVGGRLFRCPTLALARETQSAFPAGQTKKSTLTKAD